MWLGHIPRLSPSNPRWAYLQLFGLRSKVSHLFKLRYEIQILNMTLISRHLKSHSLCQSLRIGLASSFATSTQSCTVHIMNSSGTVNPQWCQNRTYAVSRGPKAPLRPPPRAPKAEPRPDMFDINQITTRTFEEPIRAVGGFFDELKPEEYHMYASKFADAIKNGADPYNAKLSGGEFPGVGGCADRLTAPTQRTISRSRFYTRWQLCYG